MPKSLSSSFLLIVIIIFSIISPINIIAQVYFNDLEHDTVVGNWRGTHTIKQGNAFSGKFMAVSDSINIFGIGIEQPIPDNYSNKNVKLIVSGYIKSNTINNKAAYVINLINNKKTIFWKGIHLSSHFADTSKYSYFCDSIIFPARDTKNTTLKAYLWNQDKKPVICIDDIKFEFIPFETPSYLPTFKEFSIKNTKSENIFSNTFYSINYSNNSITFTDINHDTVINNISYLCEKTIAGKQANIITTWELTSEKSTSKGKIIELKVKDHKSVIKMQIICDNNSSEIQFLIKEKYRANQKIYRESIIIDYKPIISEIYRNNRTIDNGALLNEYWLDKQGVKIGNNSNSMIIYHTPDISSLQLATDESKLVINLDYTWDHPFFRFPLEPDSSNWKVDQSYSYYDRSQKKEYTFNINIGNPAVTLPRFMKNPAGFEATYIWTEHADFTDIRTNRAVNFGSEKITLADSAIGGFVYYNIPVTKSVFYANPDSITNFDASHGTFNTLESSILSDSSFEDFLLQIRDKGHDICLHTPEQYTTTPERFENALSYMQQNFASPSWIDHGNNNGPQNNREDLICDATVKKSPYYALNIWKKYGVKYLHNAYYEEMATFSMWQFEPSLEKPYSGYGDFIPKPDYYKHYTVSGDLYHWTTTSALFIDQQFLWNYLFDKKKLQKMINNRHVEFNHVYPAWVDPKKGMWTYDGDSVIVAQPGLNQALANLDDLRNAGKLNVTTVANYLDYRTALDNVDFEILPDGRIKITNNNSTSVRDLSFATQSSFVTVNGIVPKQKRLGSDIIFWFDIKPDESKVIRIIE